MDRFSVNLLGIGFTGNENVYVAGVVKFNQFVSALFIVKENEIFNDITNQVIRDIKETWENAHDINAFNHFLNNLGKGRYRIMPFGVTQVIEKQMSADDVIMELKQRTMKFFKDVEVLKKDKTPAPVELATAAVEE